MMTRFLQTIAPPGIMALLYIGAYALKRWNLVTAHFLENSRLGAALIVMGTALLLWASFQFRRHATTILPIGKPSSIIVSGPFRFSRNPIYLADLMVTTGIALYLGSLLYWIVPVALFWILNAILIPPEETKLRAISGKDFAAYSQRVRRWI